MTENQILYAKLLGNIFPQATCTAYAAIEIREKRDAGEQASLWPIIGCAAVGVTGLAAIAVGSTTILVAAGVTPQVVDFIKFATR